MNPNNYYGGTPVAGGFDQAMQQASQQQAAAQQQAGTTPQQPTHSGNWFTHLLPTLGGLAGVLLAPETGGLSLLAAAGLSGLGTAAGKAAENVTEGKGVGDDVGTAGLEGGVGGLLGGIGGKFLGKAAESLGGRAANLTSSAEEAATQKAAQDAEIGAAQATRNNFGGAGVSRVRAANNLEGNQGLLREWGIDHTSPEAMQQASKGGLYLDDIDQAALKGGSPIKTTDLIASKDITQLTPEEEQALASDKVGIITPEGTMSQTVTPSQAHAFAQELNSNLRNLQNISDNAMKNGNLEGYKQAQAEIKQLTQKYNNVQQLAGTPDVNASIAARTVTPEEKAQLVEQFGQKQADYLENAVNSAQTHQDLVSAKLPFAQMNTLSKLALKDMQDSASPLALARAKTDINGDGVADAQAPPQPTALDVAHDMVNGNGGRGTLGTAIALGKHAANNPNILNTLSRFSALGSKLLPPTMVAASTAPLMGADPVAATNGTMGNNMNGQVNPNDLANYIHAMEAQSILGTSFSAPATSLMSNIAPLLQHNQLVNAQLSGMPALYANAGGAQGMGGILSRISGLIPGTAAHTYQAQQADIARQLGVNPAMLPGLMQNADTSGISSGILGNLQGQLVY